MEKLKLLLKEQILKEFSKLEELIGEEEMAAAPTTSQPKTYKLDELNYDLVKRYKLPVPNGAFQSILHPNNFNDWMEMMKTEYPNATVSIDPNPRTDWFRQVKINDEKFNQDREKSINR